MENMRAIPVNIDALHRLTPDVSAHMRTLVNHQAPLALLPGQMRERRSVQPAAYYQIVVVHFCLVLASDYSVLRSRSQMNFPTILNPSGTASPIRGSTKA